MGIARSKITSEAQKLLTKSATRSLPVDLEAIAERLQMRILYEDMEDDVSGLLVIKGGRRAIGVNKKHHRNRQRFTIAHEIGHFVLHHKTFEDPRNDLHLDKKWAYFRLTGTAGAKVENEYEANFFAAELLMPAEMLKEAIVDLRVDLSNDIDIARLAEYLQVSEQALTIRLLALKLVKPY